MQTTVSARWQTVVPREIRRALDIQPTSKLEWEVRGDVAVVRPIPADPVRAALGLWRGRGLTTEALLAERRGE